MENKELSFIEAQTFARSYLNEVTKTTRELIKEISEFDNITDFYQRRAHFNYISTRINIAIFELQGVVKVLDDALDEDEVDKKDD